MQCLQFYDDEWKIEQQRKKKGRKKKSKKYKLCSLQLYNGENKKRPEAIIRGKRDNKKRKINYK